MNKKPILAQSADGPGRKPSCCATDSVQKTSFGSRKAVSQSDDRNLGEGGVLTDLLLVPQYDRQNIPGCVCRTAIAAGGCCPPAAANLALASSGRATLTSPGSQGPNRVLFGSESSLNHSPAGGSSRYDGHLAGRSGHHVMGAWATCVTLGNVVLGSVGIAMGVQTVCGSTDALKNLSRAENQAKTALEAAQLRQAQLTPFADDFTVSHTQALAQQQRIAGELVQIKAARREQWFNLLVPGALQVLASACLTAAAIDHVTGHLLAQVVGASVVGAAGPVIFSLYGMAFCLKNLWSWIHEPASKGLDKELAAHVRGRIAQSRQATFCWGLFSVAGFLGTANMMGVALFAGASWLVPGLALVGGVLAAVTNSCSRYVPHLPIGPRVVRSYLQSIDQREQLKKVLEAQFTAMTDALNALLAYQGRWTRTKFLLEHALKPQCGPQSNVVVPTAVSAQLIHAASGKNRDVGESGRQKEIEHILLTLICNLLQEEHTLWQSRLEADAMQLAARKNELEKNGLIWGPIKADFMKQIGRELKADEDQYQHQLRILSGLDMMRKCADALREKCGELTPIRGSELTYAQKQWQQLRINVLFLTGTLHDALGPQGLAALHNKGQLHRRGPSDAVLALNNVYVLPHHMDSLCEILAPQLDYAFAHAIIRPLKVRGEQDFVHDVALYAKKDTHSTCSKALKSASLELTKGCCG